MTSAASRSRYVSQEVDEGRRPDLLLALHEHGDTDPELVTEHPQRADVRDHARLVVRGTAPVETSVALRRLERAGQAVGLVAGRLDVVVRVQQDRGRTRPARVGGRRQREHRPTHGRGPARRRSPAPRGATRRHRSLAATCGWSNSPLETSGIRPNDSGGQGPAARQTRRRSSPGRLASLAGRRMDGCGAASVTNTHATRLPGNVSTQQRPPARDSRTVGEHPARRPLGQGPPDAEAEGRPRQRTSVPWWRRRQEGPPRAGPGPARPRVPGDADRRRAQHAGQGPRAGAPLHPRLASTPAGTSASSSCPSRAVFLVPQFALSQTRGRHLRDPRAVRLHLAAAVRRLADVAGLKKRLVGQVRRPSRSPTWPAMYAVLRAFQIRPSRMPKPQVKHGQRPV